MNPEQPGSSDEDRTILHRRPAPPPSARPAPPAGRPATPAHPLPPPAEAAPLPPPDRTRRLDDPADLLPAVTYENRTPRAVRSGWWWLVLVGGILLLVAAVAVAVVLSAGTEAV